MACGNVITDSEVIGDTMETETTIVGNGADGAIRIAVLLPDSARDAECYTHYHSGYYIAEETRERLSEALLANYGGYRLGNVINRDYGEGYTIYTVEITPKMPLETRGEERQRGISPLPISATACNAVFGTFPAIRRSTTISPSRVARD